jgi:hypothetical protein
LTLAKEPTPGSFFTRAKEPTPGSFLTQAREGGVKPGSFLMRVKEAGEAASFFTRALEAPNDPGSFFGRRRRVGANGSVPMTMPKLNMDDDEREEDDTGPSILRGSQCCIGIVSCG